MRVRYPRKTRIIHDEATINLAYRELSTELDAIFAEHEQVILMPVMLGGLWPFVHITKYLEGHVYEIDYVRATRYRDNKPSEDFQVSKYPFTDMRNKMVVFIDDIFDEGKTLQLLVNRCQERGMGDFKVMCLFDKDHDRKVKGFSPDYVGLSVPDLYVFGCGMDYHGAFRHYPYLLGVPEEDGIKEDG